MSDNSSTSQFWSREELAAAVGAYLWMLECERQGTEYSKSAVNEDLRHDPLAGRSKQSVEYRMRNISAVMDELGHRWLRGYAPAVNVGSRVKAQLIDLLAARGVHPVGDVAGQASIAYDDGQDLPSLPDSPWLIAYESRAGFFGSEARQLVLYGEDVDGSTAYRLRAARVRHREAKRCVYRVQVSESFWHRAWQRLESVRIEPIPEGELLLDAGTSQLTLRRGSNEAVYRCEEDLRDGWEGLQVAVDLLNPVVGEFMGDPAIWVGQVDDSHA